MREPHGIIQYIEIKLHLSFIFRLELSDFQFHCNHCLQASVVKQQVDEVLPAIHFQSVLVPHKRKVRSELHQKRADILDDRLFQLIFRMFLSQPDKIQHILVFYGKHRLVAGVFGQRGIKVALSEQKVLICFQFYLVYQHILSPTVFLSRQNIELSLLRLLALSQNNDMLRPANFSN